MAITPGYAYDVFISYAHVDNAPGAGGPGWVTQFVATLSSALRMRLGGGDELKIFFDNREAGPNNRVQDLIAAARSAAIFLAIGSPSYATRRFPQDEMGAFVQEVRDPSRLFVVECLPLNKGESYPEDMRHHIRTKLWQSDGGLPMPLSPVHDLAAYELLTHTVAQRLREKLLDLRLLPSTREPLPPVAPEPASPKKTVLLAQVTGDVEEEADQLRTYLSQYGEQLVVLSTRDYPQGGDAFRAAIELDLARADLFVQLLGRRPDRVPPDLPEGYTYCQIEAAKRRGVEILQWRRPDIDPAGISDPKYRACVSADTVVVSGLETFKRQVLDTLRKPAPKPRVAAGGSSIVFIDADDKDMPFAKEIEKECLQRALTTIMPIAGKSSEATRRDLEDNFAESDALLFVYGDTTQNWIRSQLRFFSKVRQRRDSGPKIAAIFTGPPPKDGTIGINVPDVKEIPLNGVWSLDPVRTLLSELAS